MAEEKVFLEEVQGIRSAEKEKEKIIADAKAQAEKIVSKAGNESHSILAKAKDKANEIEGQIIAEGRNEIEAEEKKIISKAQKQAEKIASVEISKNAIKESLKVLGGKNVAG